MPDAYPGLPAGFAPAPIKQKPIPPGKSIGTVNRITRDLKLGIVDAAAAHGSDGAGAGGLTGYLLYLATEHPKAFAGLLGKMLPLQVSGRVDATIAAVNVVSVPGDRYLTQEDMRKLAAPAIEHQSAESDEAA
ncbi:hypothetical protein [Bradyrhizobium elkanii]|uniref:hypothetical protein n=1 Tax=Bradyrhizobium elkanii TaxID=29448 RepID=UPI0004AE860A|nr:hypothetical protein [Bradyrhizobium elkanii]WLA79594.1 hypothetical protein QNJ99_29885 [Bradyrhizobium elkanii]